MASGFPLGTRVELDLDGWVDVTGRVYARDPISITRGRSADASSTDPASCRFTLANRDDMFSMRNPLGPYYGLLRRNIPVRVSLPAAVKGMHVRVNDPTLDRLSKASAPDWTPFALTGGSLDVRVEIDADQWERGHLIGKYRAADGYREWGFLVEGGRLTVFWCPTGIAFADVIFATSGVMFPDRGPAHRAVRATVTFNDGTGKYVVTFYQAPTLAGPWVAAGTVTGAAPTSCAHSAAPMDVGHIHGFAGQALPGRVIAAEVRTGATVIASPNFAAQPVGTTSFVDAQAVTWTVQPDAEITDRDVRFYGEVSQWPQTRDVAGVDKTIEVTAYSVRRRLSLNAPALDSVMVREFASPRRANIVAYWPMEDAAGATRLASAIPGAPTMRVLGTPELASYDSWASSKPLMRVRTGAFIGTVPKYDTTPGVVQLRMFVVVGTNPANTSNLFTLRTSTVLWDVDLSNTGGMRVRALSLDADTVYSDSGFFAFAMGGRGFVSLNFLVQPNGTVDIAWSLQAIDFQSDQVWNQVVPAVSISGVVSGQSVGRATQVSVGRDYTLGDVVVGHLAVGNTLDAFAASAGALNTWNGESAEERLTRLSREDGVPVRVNDGGGFEGYVNGHRLGDQSADTWLDLLEQAEASDLGRLAEPRDGMGFVYRTRWALTNQPAKIALDYDAGEIAGDLHPVDDDNTLRNDVTVKRTDGGSARVQDTESPLSVLAPPFGVGSYADGVEITAQGDEWLPSQAAFRLRLGTVDAARYPTLSVDLHSPRVSDAQASRVRTLDVGDRIDILNADAWTNRVSQIVTGYTEDLQVLTHRFVFNLTPGDPWTAGVMDSGTDRYDTAGSELDLGVDDGLTPPDPLGVDLFSWKGNGLADGTVITAASVGTGDTPFNTVTSGAFKMSAGQIQADQVAATAAQLVWSETTLGTTRTRFGVRATLTLTAYPTASARPLQAYTASTALLWYLSVTSAGILRLHKADNTVLASSATAFPLNLPVRLAVRSLGGVVTVTASAGGSTWATLTGDVANAGPLYQVRFGNPNTAPTFPRLWLDDMAVTDPDATVAGALSVATKVGPLWTTDPAEFPFDVMCGGERMTATSIVGGGVVQTFYVTRGVNGIQMAHGAGTDIRLADPAYVAL